MIVKSSLYSTYLVTIYDNSWSIKWLSTIIVNTTIICFAYYKPVTFTLLGSLNKCFNVHFTGYVIADIDNIVFNFTHIKTAWVKPAHGRQACKNGLLVWES